MAKSSRLENLAGLMAGGHADIPLTASTEPQLPQGVIPVLIPIAKICRSRFQPRTYFNPDKIEKMAVAFSKYKARGEHPRTAILVRPIADGYELVFGEQRKLAHEQAGFAEMLAFVDPHLGDDEARELALTENLVREDLNPIEKTEAVLNLAAVRLQLSPEDVKQLLDKAANERKKGDREDATDNVTRTPQWETLESFFQSLPGQITPESFRTNYLPLLNLPTDVREALRQGKLEYTKARVIARIKDNEQREMLLRKAIEQGLSLNEIRDWVAEVKPSAELSQPSEPTLRSQFDQTYRQIKKSKQLWDDPKKAKKMGKLLAELQKLLELEQE